MPKCTLIVDSCCDLPYEMVDREGVMLLRFPYIMDGGTFEDDLFRTATAQDFYGAMRKGSEPSTSQLSMVQLTETFEQARQAGLPAVYLSFSSGLSGSYDAAMLVREQILAEHPDFELHVVDTRLASVAEALLVFEALKLHADGMTAAELAAWAEEARFFVDAEFMVDDLDALRRGGRIPASVAVAGGALDVKPLLSIDADGKLTLVGVSRGRKKGVKQLVEYYQKNAVPSGYGQYVVLGNADCPKDAARLKELLLKVDDSLMFVDGTVGPVIGSHVGPGMLAVVFWGNDKRERLSVADRIARKVKGGDR